MIRRFRIASFIGLDPLGSDEHEIQEQIELGYWKTIPGLIYSSYELALRKYWELTGQ